jgi:hypothetical protein
MVSKIKNFFVKKELIHLSNDHKTTLLGAIFGAMAISKIDWSLLMQGDKTQIATLIGGITMAIFGYYSKGISK